MITTHNPSHEMNQHLKHHLLATLLCVVFTAEVRAQGTAFTYQGQLTENSVPTTGLYDFRFTLHDSTGGAEVLAGPLTQEGIEVINGLFATTLDFGAAVFTGSDRWLEIGVRTNGGSGFTALAPRQSFTSTPYAIRAAQFSGQIGGGQLAGTYDNAITFSNPANSFNGSGAGLAELNASALASGTVPAAALGNAWRIGGNPGTTAGANFVGTTDNQPLELVVNGQRGLRLEPTINAAPNVIGGASVNRVRSGVVGATVGGGGAANYFGSSFTNVIESDFGVVSGGGMNRIGTNSPFATIGGGGGNAVMPGGLYSTVSGGTLNRIEPNSERATIAGGWANVIHSNANNATISGGPSHGAAGRRATERRDPLRQSLGHLSRRGHVQQCGQCLQWRWRRLDQLERLATDQRHSAQRATGGQRGANQPSLVAGWQRGHHAGHALCRQYGQSIPGLPGGQPESFAAGADGEQLGERGGWVVGELRVARNGGRHDRWRGSGKLCGHGLLQCRVAGLRHRGRRLTKLRQSPSNRGRWLRELRQFSRHSRRR